MLNAWDALRDPQTLEETHARAKARRARLDGIGPRAEQLAQAEARVPRFARNAGLLRPEDVVAHVAGALAVSAQAMWRPLHAGETAARDALIYWLLGLTRLTPAEIARSLDLDGSEVALAAMRRHARRAGLPEIDCSGDCA